MEITRALGIIKDLADGLDPDTKEPLPSVSVYQRPSIVRALSAAVAFIDRAEHNKDQKLRRPSNTGKPWTASEDSQVCDEFDGGQNVFSIAMRHSRTVGSIAARLVRLNKMSADELSRVVGPSKASLITDYETARRSAEINVRDATQPVSKVG